MALRSPRLLRRINQEGGLRRKRGSVANNTGLYFLQTILINLGYRDYLTTDRSFYKLRALGHAKIIVRIWVGKAQARLQKFFYSLDETEKEIVFSFSHLGCK
jgi:hypothetical protein